MRPADEFDFQRVLGRQALGVLAQRFAQRLRPLGVVIDANVMSVEIPGHPFGETQPGQRALNQHAVVTGQHASDLVAPAVGQQL